MDQVAKRILSHIAHNFDFDAGAIAQQIGAREEVVRHRLEAMRQSGLLRGITLEVDPAVVGTTYEFLVSGVPTGDTDRRAIERLCREGGVTRVFGLASRHSLAFTVRGKDAMETEALGRQLAHDTGLSGVSAVLIVNTFRDRPGPHWEAQAPPTGPGAVGAVGVASEETDAASAGAA